MTIIKTVQSKILLSAFFAALFVGLGFLAACGGGGSGSSAVATGGGSTLPSDVVPPVVPPATCSTTLPGGPITPHIIASRVTGVAPLAVFFDASTTTVTATTRPFHDLEYRWSFGETTGPGIGTWSTGSRAGVGSRNTATGPVAAHVFETPGTYTVTLVAIDGTNEVTENCVQIAVTDPNVVFTGTNTICFSTSATFTGCPSGATTVTTSNFAAAISTFQATGKRLLFRSGETWTSTTAASITATGPGIVGAFGAGARPIVQATGNTILRLSGPGTPTISDWRVMDLELNGLSMAASIGVEGGGGINQLTLLRLNIHDTGTGILFSQSLLDFWNSNGSPGHTMWDQIAVVDSVISHAIGGTSDYAAYMSARRLSWLGNIMDDTTAAEHVLRIPFTAKAAISNNTLSKPAAGKHVLKLHAPTFGSSGVTGGGFTEQVVISDNKFTDATSDWSVSIEPQNNTSDERVRDVIVERNWFVSGALNQVALLLSAVDITVRDNICDMTGGLGHTCVSVAQRGIEPAPVRVAVLNNTFFSASTGGFVGLSIGSTASNITLQNNLASAPSATSPVMLVGTGASGLVQSNNLLNNSPGTLFVSATPTVPANFGLAAGSPARDTGFSTVHVFSDFFGQSRPNGGAIDIGAAEFY